MPFRFHKNQRVAIRCHPLPRKYESHARHHTFQHWRGFQRCSGVKSGGQSANDGLRPQAGQALMFRRAVGPFLPQHAQHIDSPRGAIVQPFALRGNRRRLDVGRRALFTGDDWRLWQRRRGCRARCQA